MNYALWGKQNFVNNIKNSFFYKKFIKNLFSTKGRTNRKEYITRLLMTILLYIVSNLIYKLSYLSDNFLLNITTIISSLVCFIYTIQVFFLNHRRLHDFNASGWWQLLIPFIPFVICIIKVQSPIIISLVQSFLLVMPLFLLLPYILFIPLSIIKGTDGVNDYGEPPNY